jgi:hypothetical protein
MSEPHPVTNIQPSATVTTQANSSMLLQWHRTVEGPLLALPAVHIHGLPCSSSIPTPSVANS